MWRVGGACGSPGSTPATVMHGPSQRRLDLSLFKDLSLGQGRKLQLRAEFTNPFNRTQIPNPVIGGPTSAGSGNYTTGITTQLLANGNRVNASGFGAIATQPASAVIGERSGLLVGRITF